jgi:class I fructose-bisphosphate aldolase
MATELKREGISGRLEELLGADDARALLEHTSQTIAKDQLHLPGPDFVDRVWALSDRNPRVLRSLQALFNTGRLAGTGYLSILPVDHRTLGRIIFRAQPDLLRSRINRAPRD